MNKLILFACLLIGFSATAQNPEGSDFDCPVGGSTTNLRHMAADSLKNRSEIPDKYKIMTVTQLLKMKYSNKTSQHQAVSVKGYIMDIRDGGMESCNCKSSDFRDTHIYLVNDESETKDSKAVIVEATPRMRMELGTTNELKDKFLNHQVTVFGYLFCDQEHKQNSAVDHGKGLHWRGTVWEVHPITKIELDEE